MRLIPEPLVIGEEDDYESKTVINREEFGNFLTNLVRNIPEPLVIAIDGRWGEGKSTFVKIWRNQLECRGKWESEAARSRVPTLYIDAFKVEAFGDVFISLVAEIDEFVRSNSRKLDILASFKDTATKVTASLLPIAAKVALRAASMNLLRPEDFSGLPVDKETYSQTISEQAEKLLAERLQSLFETKEIVAEFHEKLKKLPESIPNNPMKQLVIIVDELDRCSPKFAVDFLEKIKHFFSTDNIKFVLVMNKSQFESSIKSVYGGDVDSREYMQKFIDIECSLSRNDMGIAGDDSKKFCLNMSKLHHFGSGRYFERATEVFSFFASCSKLTLRQIEKIYCNFVLLHKLTDGKYDSVNEWIQDVTLFACIVKVVDRDFCEKAIRRKINEKDYTDFIDKLFVLPYSDSRFTDYLNDVRLSCLSIPEFQGRVNDKTRSIITACGEDHSTRYNLFPSVCSLLLQFN